MIKGKSWAMLAAVASAAFASIANAGTVPSSADQLTLSKPLAMDATPQKLSPLMSGLDKVGVAGPLTDWGITIGGYVAASTTFYADRAPTKFQPGRSFDSEDQDPTLNQLGLVVERTVDVTKGTFDLGGRIEWIYGGDARFIHSTGTFDHYGPDNGPDEQFDPVQLYADVAIPVGNGLLLRVGKFVTPAGVETINPTTNALYSPGLIFNYLLPLTHTGVMASYVLNDQWSFCFGVIRGWDDSFEDKNANGVSFLGRISYAFPDKNQTLDVVIIGGPEFLNDTTSTRVMVDTVYKVKYSDQWNFAIEGTTLWETDKDSKFGPSTDNGFAMGLGGWASYKFSDYFTVNGRLEYLYDGQGIRFSGVSNNVYSATLGVNITPFPTNDLGSNLHIRPEFRYDYAENTAFGGDNNQVTGAIEAYFTF